ncbi:MAG: polysaccharide biosynthesis tyrosine autokinase [Acidobacteriota bacterium]
MNSPEKDPAQSLVAVPSSQGNDFLTLNRANSRYQEPSFIMDAGTLNQNENEVETFDPWAYLRIVRERLWIVLSFFVIVVTLVTAYTYRQRPEYDAQTSVLIDKDKQKILAFQDVVEVESSDREYFQTQLDLLRSRVLAKIVINELRIGFKPGVGLMMGAGSSDIKTAQSEQELSQLINSFLGQLEIRPSRESRIVYIKFTSFDAKLSAKVTNTLARSYIDYNLQSRYDAATAASEWLAKQLDELKTKVERSQGAVVDYSRNNQIVSLDEKQNVTVERLAELNTQLVQAESDRIKSEAIYRLSLENPDAVPAVLQDKTLSDLNKKLTDLKEEAARLSAIYQPDFPLLKQNTLRLKEVQSQLDEARAKILVNIKGEYQAALQRERSLRNNFDAQRAATLQQNEKAVKYGILKREADANTQLYQSMLTRLKEAGLSAGLRTSNIQIVDEAEVPLGPSRPNKTRNIALGMVIGLLLGVGLAFLVDFLDDSIKSPEDINARLGLAVLGAIPVLSSLPKVKRKMLPANGKSENKVTALIPFESVGDHSHKDSVFAEAYRNLRTSILLSHADKPPQIILVTSSTPSEGKTTTALNTAYMLAQTNARVLVIDCDMRRPSCHRNLGISNLKGLSTYLSQDINLVMLVQGDVRPGIDMLTAGPVPPNPTELISSIKMRETLRQLRDYYDYVVLDTPPIVGFSEGVILSQFSDGIVIVVETNKTSRQRVKMAKQILQRANAKILGVVLNKVNVQKNSYYYQYYYQYYGDYYTDEQNKEEKA